MSILPPSRNANSLHGNATDDPVAPAYDDRLQKAAEQFEALFLQQVLKQMRKAGDVLRSEDSMRSREMDVMRDLYDAAVAENLAGQRQTGIADMLVKQLSRSQALDVEEAGMLARSAELPQRGALADPFRKQLPFSGGQFKVLVDSVTRHESGGRVDAVSAKGARGLMQLMPSTAQDMAAELGLPYDEARLTRDGHYNQRLGSAYLAKLLARYDGEPALAVAAYNAGPSRVDDWLREYGDPRHDNITMREWVDQIPYQETRVYAGKILNDLKKAGLVQENLYAAGPLKRAPENVALQEKTHSIDADLTHRLRSAAFAQPIRIDRRENDL